ncbi:UDP-N-acetylglucosamine 2-epimerase [Hyaloraphidium curvatum]|nr:UDP-N-acetylglucosamine 2-epimerase [Hyaloraphidium curvatum]
MLDRTNAPVVARLTNSPIQSKSLKYFTCLHTDGTHKKHAMQIGLRSLRSLATLLLVVTLSVLVIYLSRRIEARTPGSKNHVDILAVVGTRPEAIKLAPVIKEIRRRDGISIAVITTGQHAQMLNGLLKELAIPVETHGPHLSNAMQAGQSLLSLFSRCALAIERAIEHYRPRVVLVQGDTTTALAGSHAAFYARTPLAHVEAGLRTYRVGAPFPEEFNRKSIAAASCFNFAPTKRAASALLTEGVREDRIWVTGNTVIDSVLEMSRQPQNPAFVQFFVDHGISHLERQRRANGELVMLLTCHRRENHGELTNIISAVRLLLDMHQHLHVLLPVHPNPAVHDVFLKEFYGVDRMHLLPPLAYGVTVTVLGTYADIVVTDSGGLQEESTSFHVPVIVLREVTERPEGIDYGVAKLVGTNTSLIVQAVTAILFNENGLRDSMSRITWPYGAVVSHLFAVWARFITIGMAVLRKTFWPCVPCGPFP